MAVPGRDGNPPGPADLLDPGGELRAAANDCVHCGFCLPACPTYQLWGEEMDSPRGRIHLMSQILDGAPVSRAAVDHLDRCLGCMACMPACPSGVHYDRLIEGARAWTDDRAPGRDPGQARSLAERALQAAIFATFPYPRRLRLLTGPLRAAQGTGLARLLAGSALAQRAAPALASSLRLAPPATTRQPRLPERVPATGARRAVVGMLTGCVQRVFFPHVNAATARVLAAEGCDVIIPRGQGCCGALSLHSGRASEARDFARRAIGVFEAAGVDAIVVNSAGCGSAMKDYQRLLAADPDWAGRAAALTAKVRDVSEFLTELAGSGEGLRGQRHPLPVLVAYHDACHLANAQGIRSQPRELLRAVPELKLAEIADGACCGSAGVYNLLQPEAAGELGERKAAAVRETGAPLVVSGNPGCSLQISAALAAGGGEPPAVAHITEVLDASLRGLPPAALTSR
ncbi:MAG: 4Fe-4S dicluster domain-containing protein [Actinobacteria bacterium]|nr:4Fe-4S dicluster domain-containing protein [Actinomycetota bacterium]MBO0787951.1 4Fe-4S dicluster domain-containing protein [Actinomycetota bacterium]